VNHTLGFLVRAAHEFRRGGWVFTGFHWPVLAGQRAARLPAGPGEPVALARRFGRVVLDAANVDVRGRVNSSFIGPREQPTVRLPGGGGSSDIVARAAEVVWLHGGGDPRRVQAEVEHVTAAPAADAIVRLHCRWCIVRPAVRALREEIAQ
jgi:glutaconate CoA-transferase subunit B